MKVELQRLESAYLELRDLHQRLEEVSNQVRQAERLLRHYRVGGSVTTDRITEGMNRQIAALKRRANSFMELARVLQMAIEEYERCEDQNRAVADGKMGIWRIKPIPGILDQLGHIPVGQERTIISQYIMPLIITGKMGET